MEFLYFFQDVCGRVWQSNQLKKILELTNKNHLSFVHSFTT